MNRNLKYKKSKSNIPLLILIVAVLVIIIVIAALFKPKSGQGKDGTTLPDTTVVAQTTTLPDTTEVVTTTVTPETTVTDEIIITDAPVTTEPATTPAVTTAVPITEAPVTTVPVTTAPVTNPPVTTAAVTTAAPSADPVDNYPGTPATYANQIPASAAVGNEFFADALFIGDSRTVGFQMSTQLSATFYAKVSLNIGQLQKTDDTSRFLNIKTASGTVKCNVYEALNYQTSFKKVYLCMGLSELGWNENSFFNTYRETINYIKSKLPGATIYLETIIPVSSVRSNKNIYGVTNKTLWHFNERIAALAEETGSKLVNVAEKFTTEAGTLPGSYAPDGVHMSSEHYVEWLDYLRTHT